MQSPYGRIPLRHTVLYPVLSLCRQPDRSHPGCRRFATTLQPISKHRALRKSHPGQYLLIFSQRSVRFADAPTVPFADVTEISNQFDWYAEVLSLNTASLLAPDLGGTLYYSSLQVYDLAGLTDRTVARTMGKDQAAFYKYVFENIRPTFIEIHDFWTFTADFDRDRRFRQEYTPICEYPDDRYPLFSGHFVRQDVVKNQPEAFQYLQSQVDAGNKCKLVRDFAALQE